VAGRVVYRRDYTVVFDYHAPFLGRGDF